LTDVPADIDALATIAVDCGFKLHMAFGPGLLESVYEAILTDSLTKRGLRVERQKPVDIHYEGTILREGFRIDLLVEDQLIIELKSTERTAPVHKKQLLTYLRLTNRPLGLLMNFGMETFKEGMSRVINQHMRKP
jgi:iron complex transport system substrate-binding protein